MIDFPPERRGSDFQEILSLWLKENCPKWQVWYGALIEIAPVDDWPRWNLATKFWVGGEQVFIHVWKYTKSEGTRCIHIGTLSASDPKFFQKLKRRLNKYEKQFKNWVP